MPTACRFQQSGLAAACLATILAAAACGRDPQAYVRSGDAYAAEGRHAEAIIQYRNAIKRDPRFAAAYIRLGQVHLEIGEATEAYEAFARASKVAPQHAEAHLHAGAMLLAAGRVEDARARCAFSRQTPATWTVTSSWATVSQAWAGSRTRSHSSTRRSASTRITSGRTPPSAR